MLSGISCIFLACKMLFCWASTAAIFRPKFRYPGNKRRGVRVEVAQYSYLWNGSQSGWVLLCMDGQCIELTIESADCGPSARELRAIRKVVPEFQALSLSTVIERLKAQSFLLLESLNLARLASSPNHVWTSA